MLDDLWQYCWLPCHFSAAGGDSAEIPVPDADEQAGGISDESPSSSVSGFWQEKIFSC